MATGVVKFFLADKGYGFISRDEGTGDVFVHIKDVKGMKPLFAGMQVDFEEVVDGRKGKVRAARVRIV